MTLAELYKARDDLHKARFNDGARVVEWGERRIEYRSDAELRQAMVDIERQIREAEGRSPVTTIRITSSKGL